jgi:hypothetical protein
MDEVYNRMATRRENPLERRSMDRDRADCESACPVAIRNHEQIATLFRRMDEERVKSKAVQKDVEKHVSWDVFMWVVGGCMSVMLVILGVMWYHFSGNDSELEDVLHQIRVSVAENSGKIDVAVTKMNSFIISHEQIMNRSTLDQTRLINKLDEIGRTINTIQIDIGRLQNGQQPKKP